jgi:phosphoketolase
MQQRRTSEWPGHFAANVIQLSIIFGFHGYTWLVHRLTYRRTNRNLHVRGYKEEGTITTAFDIRVQNDLDRFRLVQDVIYSSMPICRPSIRC